MEINNLPEMPVEEDGYLLIDNGTTYKISTETIRGEIVNTLTETTAGKQLDARQGRILNNANTDNVAALAALNAVIDSELQGPRSMQALRLPGSDTENVIPTTATDMVLMVSLSDFGNGPLVFTKLYNPLIGDKKLNIGGFTYGSLRYRITANADPGGTNSIVSAETTYGTGTLSTDDINLFRFYDPDQEQ